MREPSRGPLLLLARGRPVVEGKSAGAAAACCVLGACHCAALSRGLHFEILCCVCDQLWSGHEGYGEHPSPPALLPSQAFAHPRLTGDTGPVCPHAGVPVRPP